MLVPRVFIVLILSRNKFHAWTDFKLLLWQLYANPTALNANKYLRELHFLSYHTSDYSGNTLSRQTLDQ